MHSSRRSHRVEAPRRVLIRNETMAGPRTPNKPVDPLAEKRSKVESFELDARLLEARLRTIKAKIEIETFRAAGKI